MDLAPVFQDTIYSRCDICSNRTRCCWAAQCCLSSLGDLIFSAECGWMSLKCLRAGPIRQAICRVRAAMQIQPLSEKDSNAQDWRLPQFASSVIWALILSSRTASSARSVLHVPTVVDPVRAASLGLGDLGSCDGERWCRYHGLADGHCGQCVWVLELASLEQQTGRHTLQSNSDNTPIFGSSLRRTRAASFLAITCANVESRHDAPGGRYGPLNCIHDHRPLNN